MNPFVRHTGIVAPLNRAHVDTDAMMPKQYLKSVKRTDFGQYLFDEWRYTDEGDPNVPDKARQENPDFELNQPQYQGASILLTQENFGCGSSREHAPWGLAEYGFRAILAPSFADIFANNCLKNGLLPITLAQSTIDDLFGQLYGQAGYQLTIDLPSQQVQLQDGSHHAFEIAPLIKEKLIKGLDDIAETLLLIEKIKHFEGQRRQQMPWLFTDAEQGLFQ